MRRKLLITIFNVIFLPCMFEVGNVISCINNADCNDNNPCTEDVCFHPGTEVDSYCIYAPNSFSCDDGIFCNGADICGSGSCSFHSGNPCPTGTSCNEGTDSCDTIPNTFSISGYVTGAVLEDVSIQLAGAVSTLYSTDTSGYYEFLNLNSGYYSITPRKDGYRFEPPYQVIQNLSSNLYDMNFVSTKESCVVESIYGEDSEEIEFLRNIRDNVLSHTTVGKEIIRLYYQWSPMIVKAMEEDEEFKEALKEMVGGVVELVEIGVK